MLASIVTYVLDLIDLNAMLWFGGQHFFNVACKPVMSRLLSG